MLFWNFFFFLPSQPVTVTVVWLSVQSVGEWLQAGQWPTDSYFLMISPQIFHIWQSEATVELLERWFTFFTIWLLRTNQSLVLFWFWKKKNPTIRPLSHIVICQSPSFNIQSSFHMHISKSEKLKNKTSTSVAHKQIMYLITRDWYLLGRRLCENKKHKEWPNHTFHFTVSHSVVPL